MTLAEVQEKESLADFIYECLSKRTGNLDDDDDPIDIRLDTKIYDYSHHTAVQILEAGDAFAIE